MSHAALTTPASLPPAARPGEEAFVYATWSLHLEHTPDVDLGFLNRLLRNPDALVDQARNLKAGRRCTVVELPTDSGMVVVKRFNTRGLLHALGHAVLPSRASRNWQGGRALRQAGVPVPRPLAFLERRRGPFRGRSFAVMTREPGEPLFGWLNAPERQAEEVAAVARELKDYQRRMAQAGLTHGDFRPMNMLHDGQRVTLVDLDAVRQHRDPVKLQRSRHRDTHRFLEEAALWPAWHRLFAEVFAQTDHNG